MLLKPTMVRCLVTFLLCFLVINLDIYRSYSFYFKDISLTDLNAQLNLLNSSFATVVPANEFLGVNIASYRSLKCSPMIARITHHLSLGEDFSRPQVIISGEIHGDERVGPLAALYLAQVLVWSAECEFKNNSYACNQLIDQDLFSMPQVKWLAHLVLRRDIFIIPTANCLGYMENRRNDGLVDPNRDFPYGRHNSHCLISSTAKLFNELMRTTITQLVVTFHGGMVAIGYEWGSVNHIVPSDRSPDDNCNAQIGSIMRDYASTFPGEKKYPLGRINSMIYPVEGGMEDWLYASGWDPNSLKQCDNKNSKDRSKLTSSNRAIVYLVETSDLKRPSDATLGSSSQALTPGSQGDGHVPRNTRLSLAAIDMVQPYICFNNGTKFHETRTISISWRVGGVVAVDQIFMTWHHASNRDGSLEYNWDAYMSSMEVPIPFNISTTAANASGNPGSTRKLSSGAFIGYATGHSCSIPPISTKNSSIGACFERQLPENHDKTISSRDISGLPEYEGRIRSSFLPLVEAKEHLRGQWMRLAPGEYDLVVWGMFDSTWRDPMQGEPKDSLPQSHLSNIRTNNEWESSIPESIHTRSKRRVRGRTLWPSHPVRIAVDSVGRMMIVSMVIDCVSIVNKSHVSKERYLNGTGIDLDIEETLEIIDQKTYLRKEVKRTPMFYRIVLSLGFLVGLFFFLRRRRDKEDAP